MRIGPTIVTIFLILVLTFASPAFAQNTRRPQPIEQQSTAPAPPAPKHDISGTWNSGIGDGIQANGVKAMPNDGKPEHQPPYAPYGLQVYKSHHALEGADAVLPGNFDDPRDKCEPMGFPRRRLE